MKVSTPKFKLALAAVALASAVTANASLISIGPAVIDVPNGPAVGGLPTGPWSLEVPFSVDLTTPGTSLAWAGTNWSFVLTDGALGPFRTLTIDGQHTVAPHAGEPAPSSNFNGGVLFPATIGSGGEAFGLVPHGREHSDNWLIRVAVDPNGSTASGTVYAWHAGERQVNVPDGGTTIMMLGLGLAGLAAAKSRRNA